MTRTGLLAQDDHCTDGGVDQRTDGTEVDGGVVPVDPLEHAMTQRLAQVQVLDEKLSAPADQVVPHMAAWSLSDVAANGVRGKCHRRCGDLLFADPAVPRKLFRGTAIPVACFEIHVRVHIGRVPGKRALHQGLLLEDFAPVQQSEMPETRDGVSNREFAHAPRTAPVTVRKWQP